MIRESQRPLVFGEVLFDLFEDGSAVLGGAPFNVAWHLQGLGLKPIFISRIGRDDLGRRVLADMEAWGMDTAGVQIDDSRPTGTVRVSVAGERTAFEILADQAYDFIDDSRLDSLLEGNALSLLCFGTLITRNAVSRKALWRLIASRDVSCFVDINLRPPWWTEERVKELLGRARWAKLNGAELEEVGGDTGGKGGRERAADRLRQDYGLELVVVTLGSDGAFFSTGHGTVRGGPVGTDRIEDPVGAGDAFSAVTLFGLVNGWTEKATLDRALAFAGRVCGIKGATTLDRRLYDGLLQGQTA